MERGKNGLVKEKIFWKSFKKFSGLKRKGNIRLWNVGSWGFLPTGYKFSCSRFETVSSGITGELSY
jgi:hypothetical protein